MHLKSLTLRGFKSFASATTFQLEPGITCIVGPNGSGKSNVVDALAWVMGEQGAKSLRGGKMEDVVFAGTAGQAGQPARPPLGRAEVTLTIDNTDGALPVEYAEVTISRTMFRNGGSDYAINGRSCRLLDVQELLSDSGIGREMHVIVGQGQLDAILHATPEERRGFVEEAAGVLKHRKRKEKALRKLESTEGNLTRLGDLLSELRRQLKPLGRQAEVARRAAVVQADVRDARARLLADEIVTVSAALEQELADESRLLQRRTDLEQALTAARDAETGLEAALRDGLPVLTQAQDTWFALTAVRERLQGTVALATERVRNAAAEVPAPAGRDPEQLLAEAERAAAAEGAAAAEVARQQETLVQASAVRSAAEAAHADEERRVTAAVRAAADRREGLARLQGQVEAKRSRVAAADEELDRLQEAREAALARVRRAERDFTALETRIAGLDAGEEGLDAEHEVATAALADVESRLLKLREELQGADRDRSALAARLEALELGLRRGDGAGALLAATEPVSGLLGSVAALVSVRPGYEAAVAAALGAAADAVAVDRLESALDAVELLQDADLGRAALLVGGGPDPLAVDLAAAPPVELPPGATYALDAVDCPDNLRAPLARLLRGVAVVADRAAATALVQRHPDLVAVTRDGTVVGAALVRGGSAAAPSLLEVQAAVDDARRRLSEVTHACERLAFEHQRLDQEREEAQHRADVALAKLHESDAHLAAVAEELAQLGAQARSARGEADRLERAREAASAAREADQTTVTELEQRLAAVTGHADDQPVTDDRERLADTARAARARETETRLALRTAEERARALAGRAESLRRAARSEEETRRRAAERQERVRREGALAEDVLAVARVLEGRLARALDAAAEERTRLDAERRSQEQRLAEARERARTLTREHDELVGSAHRDELTRTQQRMRLEQLQERAVEEVGLDSDTLVAEYGPHVPVPVAPHDVGPVDAADADDGSSAPAAPRTVPFDRDHQRVRLTAAERALAVLGRVNPLALEEFAALEERNRFLTDQLEDLRRTRKDLLDIVTEVDGRVEEVFTEAWRDVETAFQHVFTRLFPGGEGRLVLTDPDDMLATGIEVEARPPGKKVKRLSLLSGGERSLVAVAFLVALFKARPSPFYVLDEVEAALDDTNLGRLLDLYAELRATSQLIVITHQKRTMEIGDALYGVTMRGDGVSTVISQRLREREPA